MDGVGERIDQIVADREHHEEHQPGDARPERGREAQRLDQADRQQDAQQMREDRREEAILARQRHVLEPLHPALRIGDVDEDAFHRCLLDRVDPALRARSVDPATGAVDDAVGNVDATEREVGLAARQEAQHLAIGRLTPQLAAQRVDIGDLPQDNRALKVLRFIGQVIASLPRETAAGIDHLPPQHAPFPPALIRRIAAKPEEQRERRAEQRQRERWRGERHNVIGYRYDHIPDEQQGSRPPDLAEDVAIAGGVGDDHRFSGLSRALLRDRAEWCLRQIHAITARCPQPPHQPVRSRAYRPV